MPAGDERLAVEVEGRRLGLSNLSKVLFPSAGTTKAQVIDYYTRIAPTLLPHIADRPMTLKRYPDGVDGDFFYEKNCPSFHPEWVRTAPVPSGRSAGGVIDFCVIDDLPSLVWIVNLASIELHPYLHTVDALDAPTMVVFDLDPGPPADLRSCLEVGLRLRGLFDTLELQSVVKTSGSKGLQVYVPLNTPTSYDVTTPFARAVAQALERRDPDAIVSNMRKELRAGKVLIDWSQNNAHKTTVGVYSLRARARPTVSAPVTWEEVEAAHDAGDAASLIHEYEAVLARVDEHGDLFAPALHLEQELPTLG